MKSMYELRELLCDELDKIAEEGKLNSVSLDTVDKLTHAVKSIDTILAMNGEYNRSYSSRPAMYSRRGYSRGSDIAGRIMDIADEVSDPKVKQALHKVIEKMEG